MKYGKEYLSQMLPEWKEAYLDYTHLKTLLKDILRFKQKEGEHKGQTQQESLVRDLTFYRSFSGLHKRKSHDFKYGGGGDIEDQFIVVKEVKGANSNVKYETNFLEDATDQEVVFFNTLDYEFSKVDKFYKDRVEEVMNEVLLLNKQMDALIALRIKVENPNLDMSLSGAVRELVADVANLAATSTVSNPSPPRMPRKEQMFVIQETGLADEEDSEGSNGGVDVDKSNGGSDNFKPAHLEILEHVKINNEPETPKSTIKAMLLKGSKDKKLKFNRKQLKRAEEQLKQVFIEFHWKLRQLKHYSFMNLKALSKAMKKYDKITLRGASKSYLWAVDNSYIGSSDEITAVLERVETTFVKHFCDSNRRKGMKSLRPTAKKAKHKTTFFLGYFAGCTTALLVALVLVINARKLVHKEGRTQYMENIFPLYSLFAFIILHMLMYAVNIYFWRCYRVNYPFIFGFKQGTELGYREVFLLSAGLTLLSLAGVLANLDMEMDPGTQSYQTVTELVPLGLVTLVLAIAFCPFNSIYRSGRFFFIKSIWRCICAPFYKVTLIDFFLADQLTSQVQAFRSLEFYICYYVWGDFRKRQNSCRQSAIYNSFYFIVAVLPYWSRLLQCLRRWVEEKDVSQVYNGLKYLLTIIAVLMRTAYDLEKGTSWRAVAIISSAIAAIMSTYWDIVKDWGLLQRHSKNPWLRDKLLISHTSVYFIAMVLDVILRLAWLQSVVNFNVPLLHRTALTTIVACLEILRRGMWNFFRLENEHLNNVGKFRAFKSVPLPFNYYDEDSSKDD
ncbi:phosphate transporter PHO1 homolog 8-like [Papaver somniferum]|uniref:phosphate transporter PHO1 homolog 8-like n=1 Tax=Papaver somniferum TaxID=3469 RepID=UPI000E6FF9C2|nr:phosphate transporter PHO1 homolog 8-like [Papaver somniferum]XP_026405398.1 phosphate transporter PHO1 homolog 8-like [Papaver somniferum]XP_026405399.1 phosphate transporter PHO1 homolog 8-like [Papaver somniferum]XP_026405401.1 phosphate transporter PHO1 homolog 8-like [Papaver somniferum]